MPPRFMAPAAGRGVMTRVEATGATRYEFDERCRPKISHLPPPVLPDAGFTDEQLAQVRDTSRGVVVYVWSPHMPLSLDGYAEISAAAALRASSSVVLRRISTCSSMAGSV